MTPAEFRAKRTYLGLTQPAMAEAIGVDVSTVTRYEAGARQISRTVELLLQWLIKARDGSA